MNGEQETSVWEYVNPIAIAGDYLTPYVSPLQASIFGTYRNLARGKFLFPGYIPTLGNFGAAGFQHSLGTAMGSPFAAVGSMAKGMAGGAWNRFTTQSFRSGSAGRFTSRIARSLIFGEVTDFGSDIAMATARLQNPTNIGRIRRLSKRLVPKSGLLNSAELNFPGMVSEAAEKLAPQARTQVTSQIVKAMNRRGIRTGAEIFKKGVMRAAAFASPFMDALALVQVGQFLGETAYKGVSSLNTIIERSTESMRGMELGMVTAGYLTDMAATERQRALQAIQSSHLSGRRFMGSEAILAH